MKLKKKVLLVLVFFSFLTSCHKDMDDVVRPVSSLEIKRFIWRAMNNIYLYKDEVPQLGDDYFQSEAELDEYLQSFSSPEELFYQGLVAQGKDDFSFLADNYPQLEKSLDGITVSNGMQFGLIRYTSNSSEVLGYVRYVLPNTSAEEKGIERGDLFNTVDGQQLTVENFSRLLEPSTYTIGLAKIEGDVISPIGESVTLQKREYTANPVYLAKVIETEGGKIGYLVYNGFRDNFDGVLNETFGMFKAAGITDLIVDLRYNSGGSVETAVDLGSMITGQFKGEVFYKEQWNNDYQEYFEENNPEALVNRFDDQINTGTRINSLGLNRVYVITTLRTASASELLINGLEPYIDVIQVGERTTGKFQASVTMYDSHDFKRRGANPGHTYAVQPLIYKTVNANGKTDYFNGLQPDVELAENVRNLGIIGDINEPLLRAVLNVIEGKPQEFMKTGLKFHEVVGESGMKDILYQKMYIREFTPEILK